MTVHIDPEDDEEFAPNPELPNSHQLSTQLIKKWRKLHPDFVDWTAHYMHGQLQLDLVINAHLIDKNGFLQQVIQDCQQKNWPIKTIRILSEHTIVAIIKDN